MTDRETSALLDELAGRVDVGPAPVAQLLRAGRRARRRRVAGTTLAVAAGAAVVAGGAVTVVELAGTDDPPSAVVAEGGDRSEPGAPSGAGASEPGADGRATALPEDPTADRTGPLPAGAAASCAAEYTAEALAELDFAFDGVVRDIGPSVTGRPEELGPNTLVGVTFSVQEWFHGGSAETVTVDLPAPSSAGTGPAAEHGPAYGIGSRLLVSGADRWEAGPPDDFIAWTCGFTRYYDEATAESWR